MGTWISHLRIAEELLLHIPDLEVTQFVYGSLAPDSGKPNENWTQFDPPKEVTHFFKTGQGEGQVHDLDFYRSYLVDFDLYKPQPSLSFELGYYAHLLCDRYWAAKFGPETKKLVAALLQHYSEDDTWELIKTDWYGQDHKYLREHPESVFWQIYLPTSTPKFPMPFLPQDSFEFQTDYIKQYYTTPKPERILDRAFPYLNESSLNRYIGEASAVVMKALVRIHAASSLDGLTSAVDFLSEEELKPYSAPLGDA